MTGRFQGLVTAVGLAIGLLLVAGGGLLNAAAAMPGLDATAPTGVPGAGHIGQPTTTPTGTVAPAIAVTTTATAQVSPTAAASATATLQPTATPTTGTVTPTPDPTAIPAKLAISPPSVKNATCAANNALATLNLSNPGAPSNGLDWTAMVDSKNSANVTLSTTADGKNPISTGHLNGGDTASVYAFAGGGTVQSPVTIIFTTTPTAAGPVTVTITCA